jgi:hypothetical protein
VNEFREIWDSLLANIHQEGEEEVVVVAQEALLHQEAI